MSDREPLRFDISDGAAAVIERMLEDASIPTLMVSMSYWRGMVLLTRNIYKTDWFPPGITAYAAWLYWRFKPSY